MPAMKRTPVTKKPRIVRATERRDYPYPKLLHGTPKPTEEYVLEYFRINRNRIQFVPCDYIIGGKVVRA